MRRLSHWVGSWRCFQQLEKEFLLEGGSGWCVNPSTTDLKLQILLLSLNEAIGTITNIFLLLSISWLTVTFRLYHNFFNLFLVFLHLLESSKKKKKKGPGISQILEISGIAWMSHKAENWAHLHGCKLLWHLEWRIPYKCQWCTDGLALQR